MNRRKLLFAFGFIALIAGFFASGADLWPAPELRFGRDLGFVRVNRHACWLLPRSPEAWRFVLHRRLGRLLRSLRRTLARFGLASEPAPGPVRGPGRKS